MSSMLSRALRAFLLSPVLFAAHAVNAETPDLPSAAATFPLPAPVVQPLPVTDPIASALSQWNMLRRNDNLPFSAYANFLAVNQGWPGEAAFRKNAERAIKPGVDSASAIREQSADDDDADAEVVVIGDIKLSKRQKQLILMLDRGLSNRDIAAELSISEHTVKVHLWRLFRRLGVKSRTQTLHFARQHGLL